MAAFVRSVVAVIIRAAVLWIAGWVAAHGGPQFTDSEIGKVVAEATPVVLVIIWSIYQKFHARQKLMVAQASGKPVSENHVDVMVSSGQAPSVLTEAHVVPTLQPMTDSAIVTK